MSELSGDNYKRLYIREISKCPVLSKEETLKKFEEMSLASDDAKRDEIRDEIVKCNQRLVLFVVNNYTGLGADFYDLFNEGCLSLIEAAEKFDYRRGYSFTPFAIRAIRYSIKRYLDKNPRIPGLSIYMNKKIRNYENVKDELYKRTGSYSREDIAKELGVDPKVVAKYELYAQNPLSIDSYIRNDNDRENTTHKDLLVYKEENKDLLEDSVLIKDMEQILSNCGIKPRDLEILKTRYGFYNNDDVVKPDDVAKKFGITRQRVNKIEKDVLIKIRAYVISSSNKQDFYISKDKPNGRLK